MSAPDDEEDALAQEHARLMDFTGRPMTGFVFVGAPAVAADKNAAAWVTRTLSYTSTLPPKRPTR